MNKPLPIILAVLFLISCAGQDEKTNPATAASDTLQTHKHHKEIIAGNFSDQKNLQFDSSYLDKFFQRYPDFKTLEKEISKFYQGRSYAYAWFDESGPIEQIYSLNYRIHHLEDDGLKGTIPHLKQIDVMMDENDSSITISHANPEAELLLTSAYLNYASKAWEGISESESKKLQWFLPRKKLDLLQLMDSLIREPMEKVNEPVFRQYALLKSYLKLYRDIQNTGGWPQVRTDKKKLQEGDSASVVAILRKRLHITGDLSSDTSSEKFDSSLTNAVKKFQSRHGLTEDGSVGPSVIAALNIPVDERIKQLVVNMERCRWVPARLQKTNIAINIPSYELYMYNGDSIVWTMNVVVGEELNKTVIFSGDLKYIVFSPYWNVPPGIMKKEVLPGIRRNPNYLKKHNMEWNGKSVRQKPGPWNSLGKVKFLFPNSYNIYLHDTPAKTLFSKDKRAFSHGCIRLAEPKKLAMYLLRDYPEWTEEKIDQAMNQQKEQYVTLREPVPVYIAYLTSWVGRNGRLQFRQDIYSRDEKLAKLILSE